MKTFIKKLFLLSGYRVTKHKEPQHGKKHKRFEPYEVEFLGHILYVHDCDSFILGKQELFEPGKQAYNFIAKNEEPFIIDCGANLGMSVIYFKTLYPKAKVLAFEADPYIYSFLKKNVQSFNFSDVKLVNKAVWNISDCYLPFFKEGGAGGRIEPQADISANYIQVETTRLRHYLSQKVDFLKIDIEGAEVAVLEDCAEQLKNVEALFIEYHSFSKEKQELDLILRVVQNAGFRYYIKEASICNEPFVRHAEHFGMDLQLNVFCYRSA